jgi:8-oxo-dGTP pyrophosphatase MutT (NUDIX family)
MTGPSALTAPAIREALQASVGRVPVLTERMTRRTLTGEVIPRLTQPPEGVTSREGAVMALLYPKGGEITLALTERTAHLGSHAGQISMPGGRIEASDATPWHAAVRETHEEIGVDLSAQAPWATLDRIYVAASRFYVTAFVTYVDERPGFRLNPHEVAGLLEVPLSLLMHETTFRFGERDDNDGRRVIEGFFQFQSHKIWGATAVLLDQLLARITVGRDLAQITP